MNLFIQKCKFLSKQTKYLEDFNLNNFITIGKVVDVYDGDTCRIILVIDELFIQFICRLANINTPELKDKDISAFKARTELITLSTDCKNIKDDLQKKEIKKILLTNKKIIKVYCHKFDKYGRLLVTLYNLSETDINNSYNNILVNKKLAIKYNLIELINLNNLNLTNIEDYLKINKSIVNLKV